MPEFLTRVVAAAGWLAVLLSSCVSWFSVPVATWDVAGHAWVIQAADSPAALLFRVACAIGGLLGAWCIYRGRAPQNVPRALGLGLLALLLFPYVNMIWNPSTAATARWFFVQHGSFVSMSGDLFRGQEYRDAWWRAYIDLADLPLPVTIFPISDQPAKLLQWGNIGQFMEWLGYSPLFCMFAKKGWGIALAGLGAVLPLALRQARSSVAAPAFRSILGVGALAVAVALSPLLLASAMLASGRRAAQAGAYERAIARLESARRVLPALAEDTFYVRQKGTLQHALGWRTMEARLHEAELLESQARDVEAISLYGELLRATPQPCALQREILKGFLRAGTRAFNGGQIASAEEAFEKVLGYDPANLKANYALQLVYLRTGQVERVRELVARSHAVYRALDTPTKGAALAWADENLAFAEYAAGHPAEALAIARAFRSPPHP